MPREEKIIALESLSTDHCHPPCHCLCAVSCRHGWTGEGDRHQWHEVRPLRGPPAAILFLGQRAQAGRPFFISSTYKTYHHPGLLGWDPHAHMHRPPLDRPTPWVPLPATTCLIPLGSSKREKPTFADSHDVAADSECRGLPVQNTACHSFWTNS